MFKVKKSTHSKKIVKQLKREYKEDLEKTEITRPDSKSGRHTIHVIVMHHISVLFVCSVTQRWNSN